MPPDVLPMRPRYIEKLWGGARLQALPAKRRGGHQPPPGVVVGESWEVADLPEGASTVDDGPWRGLTLREVVTRAPAHVVGARTAPGLDGVLRFPLLVKLIDAGDDLSVQVHPDDSYAAEHAGTFAKDEAWLVVDAAAGAQVLHGFREGVTAAAFRDAIDAGHADRMLRAVRVSPGDVLRIAPGTVHAVGRGCLLLEVQEPSDTTFRVWDYGRVDKDGRPRALHVEQALAVARFGVQLPPFAADAAAVSHTASAPLVRAERYSLSVLQVGGEAAVPRPADRPAVLYVLRGALSVGAWQLPEGAAAVVCAGALQQVARGHGTLAVMTT